MSIPAICCNNSLTLVAVLLLICSLEMLITLMEFCKLSISILGLESISTSSNCISSSLSCAFKCVTNVLKIIIDKSNFFFIYFI